MGTSKAYGGPGSGLVPSWVDDPAPAALPGGPAPTSPAAAPGQAPQTPPAAEPNQAPAVSVAGRPDTAGTGTYSGARRKFASFARSGDSSSLGGALRRYVGSSGGPAKAARRMGAANATGGRLLSVVRDAARRGVDAALRMRGLQHLVGQPAEAVFMGLIEIVCPPGGPIDEALARQALLDAIGDQAEAGALEFSAPTLDQLRELFIDFVIRSVEGRVIGAIGAKGISLPDDVDRVTELQQQLHDFVAGCCRSHLLSDVAGVGGLTDRQLDAKMNAIYEAAFGLIADAGEAAE
jgi:hypothetical protein